VIDGAASGSNEGVSAPSAPDATTTEGAAGGAGAHFLSPEWSGGAGEHPPEPGRDRASRRRASATRLVPVRPHAGGRDGQDGDAAIGARRPTCPAVRWARVRAHRRPRALTPATATAPEPAGAGAPRRSTVPRPAVARLRRRRRILLAGIGTLIAAGVALAVAGVTLVRHSTAGRYIEGAGPDDPGYEAFVVPTPVMALFQRGDDGELVGVALLALESRDGNGSVVLVAPSTLAGAPGSESTLATTYRDGGAEGLAAVLADLLATAIPEHFEVDDPRWASLVGPVAPVELQLDEPVGEWPAGDVSLTADDVGPFLAALAAGEDDADRIDRQEAFWTAWLPLVERAGDDAVPGEIDVGIGRFVRGLAEGEASIAPLPMAEAEADGADAPMTFRVNGARLSEVMARAVPYPESPGPDRRIRVRLLNGTRDADLTSVAASRLVEGGAQISIVGNAASFDVPETHMTYGVAEERVGAEWLAAILGGVPIGEDPAAQQGDDADEDDDIDVTVILGADAPDLIGR
jgi:hypothetical protein